MAPRAPPLLGRARKRSPRWRWEPALERLRESRGTENIYFCWSPSSCADGHEQRIQSSRPRCPSRRRWRNWLPHRPPLGDSPQRRRDVRARRMLGPPPGGLLPATPQRDPRRRALIRTAKTTGALGPAARAATRHQCRRRAPTRPADELQQLPLPVCSRHPAQRSPTMVRQEFSGAQTTCWQRVPTSISADQSEGS